jgi:7tm Chemosensory receptor
VINQLLSPLVLLTILCQSIVIMSCSCIIAKSDYFSPIALACLWSALMPCGQVLICCLASETILHQFDQLCKRIEWRFASREIIASDRDYQEFALILSLKHQLLFRASHFFSLRLSTVLSVASFVITYTVILIQTDGTGSDVKVLVRTNIRGSAI